MSPQDQSVEERAKAIAAKTETRAAAELDRAFIGVFFAQWVVAVGLALRAPRADNLFLALVLGAAVATVPAIFVVWRPGAAATRHSIAVTQMLYGALFVHLTGATHGTTFHVFASLAFLALYRDWRVILTATFAASVHVFAPFATFQVAEVAWVAATDAFLVLACIRSERNRKTIVARQVHLDDLVTNMSRDIRTPMNAILGAAELLLDPKRKEDPRSQVRRIYRSGTQLIGALAGLVEPEEARPTVRSPNQASAATLDCSVLVAEDGVDNQMIVREYLERAGVKVTVVENGQLALDAVNAATEAGTPFDVVLMDMEMPVLDGYAATTELRRRGYGGPILALTARALPGDRARCVNAGCTDYLTKPITRERLVQAVGTHALGSAPTIPPGVVSTRGDSEVFSDFAEDPDMAELLDGFVTRLSETAARIEAAVAMRDKGELERLAHQLRGAAGSYGFPAISETAGRLERASKAAEDTAKPAADLTALCRRARARSLAQAA